jgi:ribonuclease E
MSKKMLIDAGHSEETRVVVVDGSKVEEFDFESAARKPIRGNIYLAKVTRVEPSLQAAFVEYGGNRHGFLAFNEIHPDYYQIPYEDRLALAEEEASAVADESDDPVETESPTSSKNDDDGADDDAKDGDSDSQEETAESMGGDDDDDIDEQKAARRRRQLYRKYKIQEVIKRRQVLLVQAAKEERGNKGAALTTYLSLAGRYCVLMPNTPRGGGISRKISNVSDRKRLKSVVSELDLPKGVGLIIRTAGASRTKTEIRRDADYLLRLWETIRDATLKAVAPTLIYEEGNLVKRAIRDLYDKEIEGVLVQGEAAYKAAKAFMKMLMPSHAKNVQHYKESVPLFLQYQVESQLEAIYSPIAPLKSGGYLVINPTEALVSIDVNSGRSTRERNIETTALKTNLEAATETARQMRLRDLAGLVVIDFIDMDENKNNRAVEKRMKDALARDRARLQVGRISQFGLMEISRQRRRASIIEGSTTTCPTCSGAGHVRSVESSALVALRGLEEEGLRGRSKLVKLSAPTAVILYLFNDKRDHLLSIEEKFEMRVSLAADDEIILPNFTVEPIETRKPGEELVIAPITVESFQAVDDAEGDVPTSADEEPQEGGGRKRRRRRRRKPSRDEETSSAETSSDDAASQTEQVTAEGEDSSDSEDQPRRRRRRGRRGGRGRRRPEGTTASEGTETETAATATSGDPEAANTAVTETSTPETPDATVEVATPAPEKPKRKRAPRRRKSAEPVESSVAADAGVEADSASEPTVATDETPADTSEKPKRRTRRPRKKADTAEASPETTKDEPPVAEEEAPAKPRRRTRRKKTEATPEPTGATGTPEPVAAKKAADASAAPEPKSEPKSEPKADDGPAKPARKGWWNRTGLFGG